jgi:iron complex outermembrane receptor protein
MKPNRTLAAAQLAACLVLVGPGLGLNAQTAVTPPPPANNQEVVELSPFTVNTSRDVGYAAENTLAGSRLNSALRDTAGSVSVFTREFLDDLAITDIRELVQYSVNAEMNTNENQAGNGQNPVVNAERLVAPILIRGTAASLGVDYFTSITPTDPYRVGRYEDNRGPNSILFGLGSPGGLINESSKFASTARDAASIRYGTGSFHRSRLEVDANKVLRKDRIAVSVAGLLQENGGWRAFDFQDKKRVFGSVTVRPTREIKITAMGEVGRDINAVIRSTVETDESLAWVDNRDAKGLAAVTFVPGAGLSAATRAVGVTATDGNATGNVHRATFIENDGRVFDGRGTFLTGTYNNAAVLAPDGTPGVTASILRVRDPGNYPANANAAGPGMYREQTLRNFTLTADWQATRNLAFNLAHNYQYTRALVHLMVGTEPTLRGDPNRTLGVGANAPANPYAGRLYFDGNWRRDVHVGDARETRLSASYALDTKSRWFGRHRFAALASRNEQFDARANSWLALAGRPYNAAPNNQNNRIVVRNYITEGSWATYRVGDWRSLPKTIEFDGRTFGFVWGNELAGANNSGGEQVADTLLGAVQNYFFEGRLVTTFGYRQDKIELFELGFYNDPLIGDIVDRDPSKAKATKHKGHTGTSGGVFHVFKWLSLIANHSTNQGLPSFVRKTLPEGTLAPASKGEGYDYGLGFDLLEGRLNAKVVYFNSTEQGRVTTNGFVAADARNLRVMDAFAGVLVGNGLPFTASTWQPVYSAYNPPANAASSDSESKGYEARIVANLTRNWRFVANYSYTDYIRKNVGAEVRAWFGLKLVDNRLQQGARQDATGRYVVDASAFEPGKTIAKWLELGTLRPQADVSTLTTSNGQSVAQEIYNLVEAFNDERDTEEKRWGLRPHKVSLFTAYDFKEGRLKGFTLGGGWRWRSANVIGADSQGREIFGRALRANDVMLAYTRKFDRLPGRVRFQLNVSNLLDETDILPVRIATGAAAPDGFIVPGGRGLGYSRYDLVAPREYRFTTTWSY